MISLDRDAMWRAMDEGARKATYYACEEAGRYGTSVVSPAHLLLGVLREGGNDACKVVYRLGESPRELMSAMSLALGAVHAGHVADTTFSPLAWDVLAKSKDLAGQCQSATISAGHLLLALVHCSDPEMDPALKDLRSRSDEMFEILR